MDALDFALRMEKDGEAFYRKLGAGASDPGLRSVLELLAEAEVSHSRAIEQMKARQPVPAGKSGFLGAARNVFQQMSAQGKDRLGALGEVALYRKAVEIERQSVDFYSHQASKAGDRPGRTVLLWLAEEERKHIRVLEAILEMIERPAVWLENAEWNQLQEF